MSDKHESKQKTMRAKSHLASIELKAKLDKARSTAIEDADGYVRVDLVKMRAQGNHTHRG